MIMPRGQQLLLPVRPLFIWSSLVAALALNMLINMGLLGRAAWMPDLLALVLVFWTIHQPLRVSIGAAFVLGLLMDVHQSALLGQHALAYASVSFLAITIHRRVLWFSVPTQIAQVWPIFVVLHGFILVVRMLAGDAAPGWSMLWAPCIEALLWPVVSVLLLWPQKRPPDTDANRPL
ncbi:MAG: rod shape-determining protein MreD [Comamonadaceae bacterium CG_4_9_14_0_8_um_filter_57_21]|nr:MAG: rod shape-determining protein MreD [Comamonadaceae bacterium CG2_30_57_122]PIZ23674.1 MAG: rod shape-determining protein MreD [Comamonadaceae bacterium CG_4_10_14_0_8_um_filter_57_29]PJC14634.1 MAG: rod shape-determining protein MreD [Comamonadaceae bacterium CG_4_9_14_0_8_um_filter_57_21]